MFRRTDPVGTPGQTPLASPRLLVAIDARGRASLRSFRQRPSQQAAMAGDPPVADARQAGERARDWRHGRASGEQAHDGRHGVSPRVARPVRKDEVRRLEPLLRTQVGQQALRLRALERHGSQPTGAIEPQELRQRPPAEAAVAVVEDDRARLARIAALEGSAPRGRHGAPAGKTSGAGGIRTPGPSKRPAAFKAAAINQTLPPLQSCQADIGSPTADRQTLSAHFVRHLLPERTPSPSRGSTGPSQTGTA
jgi:hypothetical protein